MAYTMPLQGQGLVQIGELALALLLSALIGAEREFRLKSAGLRTHTLVGLAAALVMLISKFGFNDVLSQGRIVLDPSRVAAQIVSGIGFIGGGVIFMRRDVVRGLTTAASVWFAAAVGMASGAGLALLAVTAVCGYFAIMLGFPPLMRHLPESAHLPAEIQVSYADGRGLLRTILVRCTDLHFSIEKVGLEQRPPRQEGLLEREIRGAGGEHAGPLAAEGVSLTLSVRGKRPLSHLITALSDIDGVREVNRVDHGFDTD